MLCGDKQIQLQILYTSRLHHTEVKYFFHSQSQMPLRFLQFLNIVHEGQTTVEIKYLSFLPLCILFIH